MSADDIATGYARLYGPLAVVSFVISFLPILPEEYGTLYDMAGRNGGGPAVIGILLMLCLVGCLGYAAVRPQRHGDLLVVIAVLSAVILVMLLTKPGTAEPTPGLTPEGHAAFAIAVVTLLLAVAHVVQLRRARRAGPRAA